MFQVELVTLKAGEGLAWEVFLEHFDGFINNYFN